MDDADAKLVDDLCVLVQHFDENCKALAEMLEGASELAIDLLGVSLVQRRAVIVGLIEKLESRAPLSGKLLQERLIEKLRGQLDLGPQS